MSEVREIESLINKMKPFSSTSKPLLRWVGGKTWSLPLLHSLTEKNCYNNYFEPFFGGGALFFDLISRQKLSKSYINDINRELILMYDVIKSNNNSNKLLNEVLYQEELFNQSKTRDSLFLEWKQRFNQLYRVIQ